MPPPDRIEVYDNSHVQGTHPVGAMIVAGPEGLVKKAYRKFNIKGEVAPGDDYAMMREVLTRRFARALTEDPDRAGEGWPDLVLIDGGAGQLAIAREVMAELGIADVALVGIAKGPDRNAGREHFHMPDRAALHAGAARPGALLPAAAARRGAPLRHRHAPRPPVQGDRALGARRGRRASGARARRRCCTISARRTRWRGRGSPTSRRCRACPARSPGKSMTSSTPAGKMGRTLRAGAL